MVEAQDRADSIREDYKHKTKELERATQQEISQLEQEGDKTVEDYEELKLNQLQNTLTEFKREEKSKNIEKIQNIREQFNDQKNDLINYVVEEVKDLYGNR